MNIKLSVLMLTLCSYSLHSMDQVVNYVGNALIFAGGIMAYEYKYEKEKIEKNAKDLMFRQAVTAYKSGRLEHQRDILEARGRPINGLLRTIADTHHDFIEEAHRLIFEVNYHGREWETINKLNKMVKFPLILAKLYLAFGITFVLSTETQFLYANV